MSIPQVPGQVKRGPVLALRAVFAGIGKVLMAADRPPDQAAGAAAPADGAGRPIQDARSQQGQASGASGPPSRWRSLDQTGNVRLLSAEDLDDDDRAETDAPSPVTATQAAAATVAASPCTASPGTASPGTAASAAAPDLPLPRYDTLSLASIRARLRGLDVGQLRVLIAYESAHEERPDVLRMLERRVEKLEAES